MSRKTTRISVGFDPAIENLKSKIENRDAWSRRQFLSTAAVAGAGTLLGLRSESLAAEPPPETTKLRLAYHSRSLCHAPLYVAEEPLKGEGFSDVQYVKTSAVEKALASGEVDVVTYFCGPLAIQVDKGDPIVLLSGLHPGCVELVGTEQIRSIRDLKGKTVAVTDLGGGRHAVLAVMASHVGIDPRKDINIVEHPAGEAMRLLQKKRSTDSWQLRQTRSNCVRRRSVM